MFVLHHRHAIVEDTAPLDGAATIDDTIAGWTSWTWEHQGYQSPYRDHVIRSALVLQALTY